MPAVHQVQPEMTPADRRDCAVALRAHRVGCLKQPPQNHGPDDNSQDRSYHYPPYGSQPIAVIMQASDQSPATFRRGLALRLVGKQFVLSRCSLDQVHLEVSRLKKLPEHERLCLRTR